MKRVIILSDKFILRIKMKNLHIQNLQTLKRAVDTDTNIQGAAQKFWNDALFGPTIIEQYYVIKSLRLVLPKLFLKTFDMIKSNKNDKALHNILDNIHNISVHNDYLNAYNGMGNIQDYISVVQDCFGLPIKDINKQEW